MQGKNYPYIHAQALKTISLMNKNVKSRSYWLYYEVLIRKSSLVKGWVWGPWITFQWSVSQWCNEEKKMILFIMLVIIYSLHKCDLIPVKWKLGFLSHFTFIIWLEMTQTEKPVNAITFEKMPIALLVLTWGRGQVQTQLHNWVGMGDLAHLLTLLIFLWLQPASAFDL